MTQNINFEKLEFYAIDVEETQLITGFMFQNENRTIRGWCDQIEKWGCNVPLKEGDKEKIFKLAQEYYDDLIKP